MARPHRRPGLDPFGDARPRQNGFIGMNVRAVRSSHCGFDCYQQGKTNTGVGRVRILLRRTRLPPHIHEDVRDRLPEEMFWPEPDPTMAHHLVDAVLTLNVTKLAEWKTEYPGHIFGFEAFVQWAEERILAREGRPDRHREADDDVTAAFKKFPTERIIQVVSLYKADLDDYLLRLSYVYFAEDQEAVRVTLYGVIGELDDENRPFVLSRAYIDPIDNRYDITEHFPGRYEALGLPEHLINDALGVPRFKIMRRAGRSAKARIEPVPDAGLKWQERRPHSRRVTALATEVQHRLLGPERERGPRPERAVESPIREPAPAAVTDEAEEEFAAFPSRPGDRD